MNIAKLQKECHEIAVARGWYDGEERSEEEYWALFHSEVSEAFEEWRRGHEVTHIYYNIVDGKPEGVPIELADLLIRIFDYMQQREGIIKPMAMKMEKNMSFPVFIVGLHWFLADSREHFCLDNVVASVISWCEFNHIGIERAIRLKMDYNRTRSYRHGNKRV